MSAAEVRVTRIATGNYQITAWRDGHELQRGHLVGAIYSLPLLEAFEAGCRAKGIQVRRVTEGDEG